MPVKLIAFERIIGPDSTVDNTNTAYKSMVKLWSATLKDARRLSSEDQVIFALLELATLFTIIYYHTLTGYAHAIV